MSSSARLRYQVSAEAEKDILGIVTWIAEHNPTAALMMFERFYDAFRLLGENPNLGHKRDDLTDRDVLFWSVRPRYQIIYSLNYNPLLVLRVLSAERDIYSLLR